MTTQDDPEPSTVAYHYERGLHCPDCAHARFPAWSVLRFAVKGGLYDTGPGDDNDVGIHALDREGLHIHPLFSSDDLSKVGDCASCGSPILAITERAS